MSARVPTTTIPVGGLQTANPSAVTIVQVVEVLWSLPLWWLVHFARARDVVDYETRRWLLCAAEPDHAERGALARFGRLVLRRPEFRSLLHHRLRPLPRPIRLLAKLVWRGERTLTLDCGEIGRGLFIQHGTASFIVADRIGRDCWINQQVTIGYSGRGRPTIGDNVRIGAAAVVIGPVHIGDSASIGVNATVVRDVRAGSLALAPLAILRVSSDTQLE